MEPGARIAFELTSKRGAALITKHLTYREDIEDEGTFEDYIKRHYNSWVDFARERGRGKNIRPVLVTGVDLTREFAAVAYSDNRTRVECEFSAGVPTAASASVSVWGSWRTSGLVHTNCGPHPSLNQLGGRGLDEDSASESVIPNEYNHCVFIRYYTFRWWGLILKAAAGPHELPKGGSGGDTAGEAVVGTPDSDDDSVEVDRSGTSPIVVHNVPLVSPEHHPRLPLLTNLTKDDRDGFDVVAEFILQVRTSSRASLVLSSV